MKQIYMHKRFSQYAPKNAQYAIKYTHIIKLKIFSFKSRKNFTNIAIQN
jgi:hypothetical protein